MTAYRPLLRYHGGKWKLAPWIISHMAEHKTYVEPFGGGGSVLIRKPRAYAEVYNDLDGDVVNLFRVARDRGEELRQALALTPFARGEFDISYGRNNRHAGARTPDDRALISRVRERSGERRTHGVSLIVLPFGNVPGDGLAQLPGRTVRDH